MQLSLIHLIVADVICCIILVIWPNIAAYRSAAMIIMHTPNTFSLSVVDAILPNPTVDKQDIVKYSAVDKFNDF